MNIAFNRVSLIPVQKLNTPDRRKMSYESPGPYFNNRISKEKMSFNSNAGSKLNYFA